MLGVIIPPVNVQGGAGPPFLAMAILRRRLGTDTQCESSISLLVKREGPVFMAALSLFGPGWARNDASKSFFTTSWPHVQLSCLLLTRVQQLRHRAHRPAILSRLQAAGGVSPHGEQLGTAVAKRGPSACL